MAEEVGVSAPVRLEILGHGGLPARVDLEVFHGCCGGASVVCLVVADDEAGVRFEGVQLINRCRNYLCDVEKEMITLSGQEEA